MTCDNCGGPTQVIDGYTELCQECDDRQTRLDEASAYVTDTLKGSEIEALIHRLQQHQEHHARMAVFQSLIKTNKLLLESAVGHRGVLDAFQGYTSHLTDCYQMRYREILGADGLDVVGGRRAARDRLNESLRKVEDLLFSE